MSGDVRADQRFTRERPCPICGGHKAMPHGHGQRCYGFLSTDGKYAHCTREELADRIRPDPDGTTYAHRLQGDCHCGQRHGEPPEAHATRPKANAGAILRRHIAEYRYLDEDGQLLYTIVRYEPKDFRPFLPDATVPGLGDARRVLYRLPQLLTADPGALVFLSESQKDADRLAGVGLVAAANDGGAKNTRLFRDAAYCEPLRGRRVVILQHHDQEGQAFAATVDTLLRPIAASVGIVVLPNLPPHGDVCDWLDAGGTPAELVTLATGAAAPNDTEAPGGRWVSLADVLNATPPPWLVDGILPCNVTAVLAGKWGSFKSFIALDFALSVATGRDWAGKSVRQGTAAYIVAEGYGGFGPRARAWLAAHDLDPEGIPICFLPAAPNLQDEDDLSRLLTELATFKPRPALIVVDTLARTNIGGEENSAKDMGRYFDSCQQIQKVTGACVLVLHHPTKNGDAIRGSGAIAGAADTICIVTRQDSERVIITCDKQKDAAEFAPLQFKRHIIDLGDGNTSIVLHPYEPVRVTSAPANPNEQQALATLLRLGREVTFSDWLGASELAKSSFARAVNGLEVAGLVCKRGSGRGATYSKTRSDDETYNGTAETYPETEGNSTTGEPGGGYKSRGVLMPPTDCCCRLPARP